MDDNNAVHPVAKATSGLYSSWGSLVANVGVPAAIALIILLQLVPRIDDGIRIADRVDGQIAILAANCGYFQRVPPLVVTPFDRDP